MSRASISPSRRNLLTMDEIIELYNQGQSGDVIAKRLNINRWTVYRRLSKMGVKMRNASEAAQKYKINDRFFEFIDTEEKAYWLGFLGADGNVSGNLLQIDLMQTDHSHLEKLKASLDAEHPVIDRMIDYAQCRFAVSNKKIVSDLAKHGLIPKKSSTLVPWSSEDHTLQRHYWRGLIDGDGSIFFSGNKWSISLNGSRSCCEGFGGWMRSIFPSIKGTVRQGHGAVFQIQVSGNRAAPGIIKALYEDCTVFLNRKKDRADKAIENYKAIVR
jgi:hypothetical protein